MASYTLSSSEAEQGNLERRSQPYKIVGEDRLSLSHSPTEKGVARTISASKFQDHLEEKSWRAPVIMILSILSATILAILHDHMNRSLNGTMVLDGPWNQQWTSRYGTALAFVIKMLFVICVGTAFVQRQWLNLSTYQQTIRVKNLDILSSALSNPFYLFSSLIWLRNPLLLIIAMISWTLPFAVIITPGTLSVESRPHTYSTNRTSVLLSGNWTIDDETFGGPNKSQINSPGGDSSDDFSIYTDATSKLTNLAFASATSSQILSTKSDFANQTYFASFLGPYLWCMNANSTMATKAKNFANNGGLWFMAWVGDDPWTQSPNFTYQNPSSLNYSFYTSVPSSYASYLNRKEVNDTLWIVSNDGTANYNVKECQLWKTSYEVEFTYQNFEQNTIVHNLTHHSPISTVSGPDYIEVTDREYSNRVYKGVLSAFASLFVGILPTSARMQKSNFDLTNIDIYTSDALSDGIEELFKNVTLSLFSVSTFVANATDMASTNVTIWSNTYIYQQRDLLLAYGMAFLASLICCIFGMHSFHRNGSSFQNNFSTYVRAAEGSDLDLRVAVPSGDTGMGPLPRKIGEKMITMASR